MVAIMPQHLRLRTLGMFRYFFVVSFIWVIMSLSYGQSPYRLPPQEVVDIIDAQPEPSVRFSPNGQWMLLVESDALPGIDVLARRMLKLGGIRIDPAAQSRFQTEFASGLLLRPTSEDKPIRIPLEPGTKLSGVQWSHRSDAFIFTLVTERGTELWYASTDQPTQIRKLTDRLSTILTGVDFLPDGRRLICCLVPHNRSGEPNQPKQPAGPNIQESVGNTSPVRTYQDLLTSAHDEVLFEHYLTTQTVIIDPAGDITPIGEPAMISSIDVSPNAEHVLATKIERPFSYLLPWSSFPKSVAVWHIASKTEISIARLPMEENIPIEGVPLGPRSISWTASDPATLHWFEALDEGDPRKKVPHRDRLISYAAPFRSQPSELIRIEHRAAGKSYFSDPNLVLVSDYDRDRRWIRTRLYNRSNLTAEPLVLMDRSTRDAYGDPGRIVTTTNENGRSVARQDGEWIYFAGAGANPQGNLPFFDRRSLSSSQSDRLWRCELGSLESPVLVIESSAGRKPIIVTRHESPHTPPNYRLRDLSSGVNRSITNFADPTPQIRSIRKQLITYQRADGVPLSATLYLPADYREGSRLPLMIWAYPLEYNDPSTAGQVTTSPSQFTRMLGTSHLTLLTQGYAILDNATMPVVGDPETMNDTFVEQIVASAKAAIDKAVELGVADPRRVAVGGHSYGAFMTANLLAHCQLFRAGVARSGAYNRTLTPFGFQSERRPFWEAVDVYLNLSPFRHAHKITTPILLIHGENDDNSGTFPIQSQRMYQAVKGNGGTVRLVMLPFESHGYRARESVLHTQAETIEWLNKFVRDAKIASE